MNVSGRSCICAGSISYSKFLTLTASVEGNFSHVRRFFAIDYERVWMGYND